MPGFQKYFSFLFVERLLVLFCLYSYSLPFDTFSQTVVPGGAVNGIWTEESSPYFIAGSIYIPQDSTLTIQAGVRVEFQNTYKLLVLGRLLAIGNQTDSIYFTSLDTTVGWRGVRFENTSTANDSSKIMFCSFFYVKNAGSGEWPDAVYVNNFSKIVFKNNLFSSNKGSINVLNGSPVIENNTFRSNSGNVCVILKNSSTNFKYNVVVSNNLTATKTGAVRAENMNGNIIHNTINNNYMVYGFGGGIYLLGGNTRIDSNEIKYNFGSGIFSDGNPAQHVISNNILSNNSTGIRGNAYWISNNIITENGAGFVSTNSDNYCPSSTVTVESNLIANNTYRGISVCTQVYLINNLIVNNGNGTANGGGIHCITASPQLVNNTIAYNWAAKGGALFCENNSDPVFTNNILWGNTADYGSQIFLNDEASDPSFYYCDIQGGQLGIDANFNIFMGAYVNNIDSNPLFANSPAGAGNGFSGINAGWFINSGSPCIDAGNPSGIYTSFDFTGNPRIQGNNVDIGAYEYPTVSSSINFYSGHGEEILLYPNPNSGKFNIIYSGKDGYKIKIFNIKLAIVYEMASEGNFKNYSINADGWQQGLYFVIIETPEKTFSEKLFIFSQQK